MARGESTDAWSTKEELLLVCAAKLHGHQSWDNIAIEVQFQSHRSEWFFTPRKCNAKFQYLHQQLIGIPDCTVVDDQTLDYMVEVLKNRRIAELTREIELDNKEIVLRELNLKSLLKGKAKSRTDEAQEEDEEEELMVDEEVKIIKESDHKSNSNPVIMEGGGDEPEPVYNLRRNRRLKGVESHCQKMMKSVLRKVQRQKHICLIERRLRSQKTTEEYKKTILQHMDLETIQSRVDQDEYGTSFHRFFFDLLLLVNNAIAFFGKNSEEHLAALQLRNLVKTEINKNIPNPFLGRDQIYVKDVPCGVLVAGLPAKKK